MIDRDKIDIDIIAFEISIDSYILKASHLKEPKGEALIEIIKDGVIIKEFLFPAYKIWNIAAHGTDIVKGLEDGNDSGLYIAGSTGFGGNIYNP